MQATIILLLINLFDEYIFRIKMYIVNILYSAYMLF